MHTVTNRLSALFSFTCQVIGVCVAANLITGLLFKVNPKAELSVNNVSTLYLLSSYDFLAKLERINISKQKSQSFRSI